MDQNGLGVWSTALEIIKEQLDNEQAFNTWFGPVNLISATNGSVTLEVPNKFFKSWLVDRYMPLIKEALDKAGGKSIQIEFNVKEEGDEEVLRKSQEAVSGAKKGFWSAAFFPREKPDIATQLGLIPRYNFDSFVVGSSNRFAHAASLAVANSPAKAYNPLFIYGGVGLGKTHLLHAIGHAVIQKSPRLKITYLSSESFTNQLIGAIQNRSTQKFRDKYRNLDVLLIDDIHFIAGKESTQEEFFHTFNTLYEVHKQIVVSSDRSPKEIPALEERLISRFGWGLVTDIQPPDLETRIAILRKKQEAETIVVPDDVMFFLAEKIRSNIRELEGALIRVVAYSKLIGEDITLDLVKNILKDMIIEGEKKVTIELIQRKVAEYFDIGISDMKAKRRTRAVAYPRQIAMYLSRQLTDYSLPEIGESFGGRDHSTVIHAYEKIKASVKSGKNIKNVVDRLIHGIKS